MLERWRSLESRRQRLARRAPPGPLRDFLAAYCPAPGSDVRTVEFAALDFETTGLDPRHDSILSAGWVCMCGGVIDLSTAEHHIIRTSVPLPEPSVLIHQLTDDAVADGASLEQVLTRLLSLLTGRVLLAHYAALEFQFLRRACAQVFGGDFLIPVVDTQWLALQSLRRRGVHFTPRDLRLFKLRESYNLPRYPAHNALSDALGTAELFAAQLAQREGAGTLRLKKLLLRL